MSSDPIQDAIELYRSGKSDKARELLKEIIQQNPQNEAAWFWYVEMLPTLTARIRAMETFLRIAPGNKKAIRALNGLLNQRKNLQNASPPPGPHPDIPIFEPDTDSPPPPQPPPANTSRKSAPGKRKGFPTALWIGLGLAAAAGIFLLFNPFSNSSPSEQEIYTESIQPILEDIQDWNEGTIMEWGIMLQSKDSWGISTYQEDIQDPVLRVLRRDEMIVKLVPLANRIATEGEAILTAMDPITPPDEIAEQHYLIALCVEFQIRKAEATITFIEHDTISQLGEDHCASFSTAFDMLQQYSEPTQAD